MSRIEAPARPYPSDADFSLVIILIGLLIAVVATGLVAMRPAVGGAPAVEAESVVLYGP